MRRLIFTCPWSAPPTNAWTMPLALLKKVGGLNWKPMIAVQYSFKNWMFTEVGFSALGNTISPELALRMG